MRQRHEVWRNPRSSFAKHSRSDKKEKEKLKEEGKFDEVKENAAYLDSLGWVLFKQKKYKEALEPLKKAVGRRG